MRTAFLAIIAAMVVIVQCAFFGAYGLLWIPLLALVAYLLRPEREDPIEARAAWFIGQLDYYDERDEEVEKPSLSTLAQAAAVECRIKFGLMRDTKANRLIVGNWLRIWLSERPDLRKVDQMRHYPMALEACFVPTQEDVEAVEFRESRTRNRRVADARANPQ